MTYREKLAYAAAGNREKYAMKHGRKKELYVPGTGVIWKYTYKATDEYQDANGATYSVDNKKWIG